MPGLARYTPTHVAAWHLRRLLAAGRWQWERGLQGWVSEALAAFPPPEGVRSLVVDRPLKGKRGKKPPWAKKGRLHEDAPFTFGLPVVSVMAQGDVSRSPLALRLVTPKDPPAYQSENAVVRELFAHLRLPAWGKQGVVVADAAYPSRAERQAIQARGWFFVLACPRTWELAHGQQLRDVVPHVPIHSYRPGRVPLVVPTARRRGFGTFAKPAQLAPVGEVTVVLSRGRHDESPQPTKLLVTTLPQATAPLTVALYLRRWPVALCLKELKRGVGLGQPHVTKDAARVARSGAVAGMAYLLVLRWRAKQIKPESCWSAFTLQQELAWAWGSTQRYRTIRQETRKETRRQQAAEPPPLRLAA